MTQTLQELRGAMERFVDRHPELEIGLMVSLRPCAEDWPYDGHNAQPDYARITMDMDRTMRMPISDATGRVD